MTGASITSGDAFDLPAIMPVMSGAFAVEFGEAWTEPQCLGVVAMPGSHLVIARRTAVIGFALSRVIMDECELMLLAVMPECQRSGIGRDLLSSVVAHARATHVARIFLEVRSGNPAIALYSSAGFKEVGQRCGYYRGTQGQSFDALTYHLVLS